MKNDNPVWSFFASVKLALFTLVSLSVTSIIGTFIQQNQPVDFYIERYGAKTYQFMQLFDLFDMYNSWWFLTLLGLLSTSLIICSIDRFPRVWKQIHADNLAISLDRFSKTEKVFTFSSPDSLDETVNKIQSSLSELGWKISERLRDNSKLLFSQKGPWSRTGVYIVHTSILVIFVGAIIGQINGFKGSLMLPEAQTSSTIYPYEKGKPIELGFEIRCNRFDIEFYSNGMPKEYRSELTVIDNGQEVLHKAIEVNDPLKYKGITFYQSSYQSYRDFVLTVSEENGDKENFSAEYQREVEWTEKDLRFGIINLESERDRVTRLKIWFTDGTGKPSEFWMDAAQQVKVNRADTTYLFSAKQRYATGLQVAKDPGVWLVYLGFGLMMVGLYMAFFMSHKRIWLLIKREGDATKVTVSGTSNKNKIGFENVFHDITSNLSEKFK